LYLSETSEEENSLLNVRSEVCMWESNEDEDLTPYQRLQAHAAFAFGTAAGGDVSQVVF
jgi:hypothetical protein